MRADACSEVPETHRVPLRAAYPHRVCCTRNFLSGFRILEYPHGLGGVADTARINQGVGQLSAAATLCVPGLPMDHPVLTRKAWTRRSMFSDAGSLAGCR